MKGKRTVGNLLWIDLETTGLSPENNQILECAVAATTQDLDFIFGEAWLIETDVDATMGRASDVVISMHDTNGLWNDLLDPEKPKTPAASLCALLSDFARENLCVQCVDGNGPWRSPLCGFSPHFDRAFLRVHTPSFLQLVSHRNVDISTLVQLGDWWFTSPTPKQPSNHRATDDVLASIDALKWIRAHRFNPHGRRVAK
jgi:oligoribonuclease